MGIKSMLLTKRDVNNFLDIISTRLSSFRKFLVISQCYESEGTLKFSSFPVIDCFMFNNCFIAVGATTQTKIFVSSRRTYASKLLKLSGKALTSTCVKVFANILSLLNRSKDIAK